ncbi:dTDP-3-amino-3,4,6-trideoxy-alpha-D-glucose transaminase [Streptomyces sp. F-1]|nr:dTDP-3-amino-3,4,6-trideoxy-alpha-D-glucose transaminase [Streptomyces sp. F-1]
MLRRRAGQLPVLFGGRAVNLNPVRKELADRDIAIVEDAANAFGSSNGARSVGATGDITCFSFGPIKNLTCGQGGIVVPRTRNEAGTIRRIRMLGVVQPPAERGLTTGYQVCSFGPRYQMSGCNAAIGIARLNHFEKTETARRILWRAYRRALASLDDVRLVDIDVDRIVPHVCQVLIPNRDEVYARLKARGIDVGVHYPPNHLQPASAQWRRGLPGGGQVGREVLTLPFHQHLSEADIDRSSPPSVRPSPRQERLPTPAGPSSDRLIRRGRQNLVHEPVRRVRAAVRTGPLRPHRRWASARSGPTAVCSPAAVTSPVSATATPACSKCRALWTCSLPADDARGTNTAGLPSTVSSASIPAPLLDTTTSARARTSGNSPLTNPARW